MFFNIDVISIIFILLFNYVLINCYFSRPQFIGTILVQNSLTLKKYFTTLKQTFKTFFTTLKRNFYEFRT